MPIPLIGAALGAAGLIGKAFSRGKANREINRLLKQDPQYVSNPIGGERLGLARTLLNARMPGSIAAERNIYTNQANATANATRAATDASQLLATAGDIQGNTNDAFNELGQREAEDYQRRYGNLVDAQEGMILEGDKVFGDQVRRFGNKVQLKGVQSGNNAANWGDLSNLGFGLMDFGAAGGFQNLFGETNRKVIKGLSRGGVSNRGVNEAPIPRSYGRL